MKYHFLVTCATGNIGSVLCLHLAKQGHNLTITARNVKRLQNLTTHILKLYPEIKVHFFSADLGKPETMDKIITHSNQLGLDGIVLMPPRPPLLMRDPKHQFETLNQAMQECFTGPRYLMQQLLPSMAKSQLKTVVFISGTSSKQPIMNAEWETFNDIRLIWVGCIKTFSDTYGPQGIRFNTISPGQILTPTYQQKLVAEAKILTIQYDKYLEEKVANIPLRRFASIENVVLTIDFFLTGANVITGNSISIDGGASRSYL